ncbi:E3 ubiquitin-protein ligase MIB2-like isoform X3 [Octopus vulgaris]|uniref:E3 ubiquitin-protein ligase MIB2-like isoform X3 n=1 Tax=Octopus vulgaris TaxID=6645 RepID=A0AA36HI44_OCTVU|nr:E3 ubiquitin-protein ligase MIB2-like isoform X3 [Octopus vulgaris]
MDGNSWVMKKKAKALLPAFEAGGFLDYGVVIGILHLCCLELETSTGSLEMFNTWCMSSLFDAASRRSASSAQNFPLLSEMGIAAFRVDPAVLIHVATHSVLPVVNPRDVSGRTPLHRACSWGYLHTVDLLLGHNGIDANVVTNDGDTPLHVAVRGQEYQVVCLLLKQDSVQLDIKNHQKVTPLQLAVSEGHLGMVHQLIAKGADVNVVNNDGNNCLHLAVKTKRFHSEVEPLSILDKYLKDLKLGKKERYSGVVVASYLAHHGANFYCKNKSGRTPLDLIKKEKLKKTLNMLFPPTQCVFCEDEVATETFFPCKHLSLYQFSNCITSAEFYTLNQPSKPCYSLRFYGLSWLQDHIHRNRDYGPYVTVWSRNVLFSDEEVACGFNTQQWERTCIHSPKPEVHKLLQVGHWHVVVGNVLFSDEEVACGFNTQQWERTCIHSPSSCRNVLFSDEEVACGFNTQQWERTWIFLGIPSIKLEIIECDNPLNTVEQSYQMLRRWITSCDPDTNKFETLKESLKKPNV